MISLKIIIVIVSVFCSGHSSMACTIKGNLTPQLKSHADIVFEGEAVGYTASQPKSTGHGLVPAQIEFQVDKMIKGVEIKKVTAQWLNGTFGESKSLEEFKKRFGLKIKVGLVSPKGFEKTIECKTVSSTRNGKTKMVERCHSPLLGLGPTKKDKPMKNWVLQGPCTSPYIVPLKKDSDS